MCVSLLVAEDVCGFALSIVISKERKGERKKMYLRAFCSSFLKWELGVRRLAMRMKCDEAGNVVVG